MAVLDYTRWMAIIGEVLASQTSVATGTSHSAILNNAGRYMYSMHAWNWRQRFQDVAWVAGQSYVDLTGGSDIEIAHGEANSLTETFSFPSQQELARLRGDNLTPVGFHTWGVLRRVDDQANLRIELHPTPTAAKASALTIWYREGWTAATEGTDGTVPDMPDYMEGLLMEVVRAFALGYWDEQVKTLTPRLAEIANGPIMKQCRRIDAVQQPDYGPLGIGAIQGTTRDSLGYLPYTAWSITS